MASAVPPASSEAFLDWFRQKTETTWSTYPAPTLEYFTKLGIWGCKWEPGTRWLGGLEEEHIAEIERLWALSFPPDYRLFLLRLHAVDRPLRCTAQAEAQPYQQILRDAPAFYNWLKDSAVLRTRMDDVVTGLIFDVEESDLWRPSWGPRPTTAESRAQQVRELVAAAPPLIPIFGHRYLLAEPCQAGNPVLSIVQSDIIVYGADLRSYLLTECEDFLPIDQAQARREADTLIQARFAEYTAIPFWGDLLAQ